MQSVREFDGQNHGDQIAFSGKQCKFKVMWFAPRLGLERKLVTLLVKMVVHLQL